MYYQGNALKKRRDRFRIAVYCVCIAILAWIIDAWGHDTPRIRNGQATHTLSKVWSPGHEDLHWHEDADERGAGGWDQCVADAYDPETDSYNLPGGQCADEPPPPPPPPPRTEHLSQEPDPPQERSTRSGEPKESKTQKAEPESEPELLESSDCMADYLPQVSDETLEVDTLEDFLDSLLDAKQQTPPAICDDAPTPMTSDSPMGWNYGLQEGWNLFHFYLTHIGGRSIKQVWQFRKSADYLVNVRGTWVKYTELANNDTPITPHMGILIKADMDTSTYMCAFNYENQETLQLHAGSNVIGFPQLPGNISKPSDLLGLSSDIISVIVQNDGKFYKVEREGDDGDNDYQLGTAWIVSTVARLSIALEDPAAPMAPMAQRDRSIATVWGAIKTQ